MTYNNRHLDLAQNIGGLPIVSIRWLLLPRTDAKGYNGAIIGQEFALRFLGILSSACDSGPARHP
jgi:hypothetical protein